MKRIINALLVTGLIVCVAATAFSYCPVGKPTAGAPSTDPTSKTCACSVKIKAPDLDPAAASATEAASTTEAAAESETGAP